MTRSFKNCEELLCEMSSVIVVFSAVSSQSVLALFQKLIASIAVETNSAAELSNFKKKTRQQSEKEIDK